MAAEARRTTLSFNKEEILSRQPFKSLGKLLNISAQNDIRIRDEASYVSKTRFTLDSIKSTTGIQNKFSSRCLCVAPFA